MAPSPYIFIMSIGPVDINKYARFDEMPSMTLKDIKERKRYRWTDGRTDNMKTVYPPTNTVCGGIKICFSHNQAHIIDFVPEQLYIPSNLDKSSFGKLLVDLWSVGDVLGTVGVVQGTQCLLKIISHQANIFMLSKSSCNQLYGKKRVCISFLFFFGGGVKTKIVGALSSLVPTTHNL